MAVPAPRPSEDTAEWRSSRLRSEALARESDGRVDDAVALLEEAVRRSPDDWGAIRHLASLLGRVGRVREANQYLRLVAEHYEREHLATRAIAVWKLALANQPDLVGIHVKLGGLYAGEGRRAEARRHYEEARERYRAAGRTREVGLIQGRLDELLELSSPRMAAPPEPESRAAAPAGAGETPPAGRDEIEFVRERLAQADLFRRYGLPGRARAQLEEILARCPDHDRARRELRRLSNDPPLEEPVAAPPSVSAPDAVGDERAFDLEGIGVPVDPPPGVADLDLSFLPEGAGADAGTPLDEPSPNGPWPPTDPAPDESGPTAVDDQVDRDDYETRYDLGIAYRSMGLVDEAIAELQLASHGPDRRAECASLLAACFLDKGLPRRAVQWLERGLALEGLDERESLSLRYDLARALEACGEDERALDLYVDLFGEDAAFRDVAEKVRLLAATCLRP
jgi:tetratricopeptide (TPR) repeat protein